MPESSRRDISRADIVAMGSFVVAYPPSHILGANIVGFQVADAMIAQDYTA